MEPEAPPGGDPGARRVVYRAVAWSGLSSVLTQAISFGGAVVLTRMIAPSAFGIMAIAVAITGVASVACDTGLAAALTQRAAVTQKDLSSVLWFQLAISVLGAALVLTLARPFAALFDREEVGTLLSVLACLLPLQAATAVPRAVLLRGLRMDRLAAVDASAAVTSAAVGIGAAATGAGVWALVAALVAFTITTCGGSFIAARWRPNFSFDPAVPRSLSGFALPLYGYNILNFLGRNGDNLLVGKFLGPFQLGLYARAYALLLVPSRQITAVLGGTLQISLARMSADTVRSRRVYLEACRHVAFVTMPLMTLVAVLAGDLVPLLLGARWEPAVSVVRVLALVGIVEPLAATCGWLYFAQGRTDLSFRLGLFLSPVLLGAIYVGVQFGSAFSTAVAYLCASVLIIPVLLSVAGGLIGIRLRDYAREVWRPAVASAAAAAAACGVQLVLRGAGASFSRLIAAALAGIVLYVVIAALLRTPEITAASHLMRGLLARKRRGEHGDG